MRFSPWRRPLTRVLFFYILFFFFYLFPILLFAYFLFLPSFCDSAETWPPQSFSHYFQNSSSWILCPSNDWVTGVARSSTHSTLIQLHP
ncbi:hypothetical protein BDV12DRAFT_84286 [Aspergillus spectabilis]